MARATYNGIVLAESETTKVVEGNHYFPPESVKTEFFKESNRHSTCFWKGEASYYNIEIEGETVANGAWYYPEPKDAAKAIKDHVAFYGMVKVEA